MLVRFERLLADEQLQELQRKLSNAQFEDGRLTTGIDARNVKHNLQLSRQSALSNELGAMVLQRLSGLTEFVGVVFPQKISQPLFSRYEPGMEYGLHVDNAVMPSQNGPVRSDIALTIFLSAPESYEGGELTIEDSGLGNHRIKLPVGSAIAYPATSLHRVAPVTRGVRLACIMWIQSQIRDPAQRRILVDLDIAAGHMRQRTMDTPELKLVLAAYHNLLRLWAEV